MVLAIVSKVVAMKRRYWHSPQPVLIDPWANRWRNPQDDPARIPGGNTLSITVTTITASSIEVRTARRHDG